MSFPDQVMLDSPAQTPDSKSQQQSALRAGGSRVSTDTAMAIDDSGNNEDLSESVVGSWDTVQWREDVRSVAGKLQHQNFNPSKYRDPTSKPLVAKPPGLTAELEQRLRKCYEDALAHSQRNQ
ncbi:unnamed protein product [Discula destructiva]